MKIKTSELTGTALDWAVAKCEGYFYFAKPEGPTYVHKNTGEWHHSGNYSPSANWSQGGPIIESKIDYIRKRSKAEEVELAHPNANFKFKAEVFADIAGYYCGFGLTPLIAAMRCYVASKLGDEVDVPKELV